MSLYHDEDDATATLADFGLHQLSTPLHLHADGDEALPPPPPSRSSSSKNTTGFVHLSRPSEPIADPDLFLSSLYSYFHHKGLGPIVASGIVELTTLFFTLYLSYVIGACIDWNSLRQCRDEESCRESFGGYWINSPLFSAQHSWMKKAWILVYVLLFTSYGIFCAVQFGYGLMASLESKLFMEEVLAVQDSDLEMGRVDWSEIVDRMAERSDAVFGGRSDFARNGAESSAASSPHLVAAQRIMRRENFMIAFFNAGLLDLTLPDLIPRRAPRVLRRWLGGDAGTLASKSARDERRIFYSKSVEWSIYFCILNFMFNHSRKIRPAFYSDPASLRKRFVLCGLAHVAFMPFLLFFVTLHFFMVNVYDWQSTKEYLGPREWSAVGRWRMREFNELSHSFERRLEPSYKCASSYLEMFSKPSALSVATGRLLVFISGSLGTLLLAFAAINDAILLHVKIGQWNLLWYAGVLGACFSVGKSLMPKPTSPYVGHARRNVVADMNSELEKVAAHTHYFPDDWRGKASEVTTKKAFSAMFQYKAGHFVMEVLSIIVAPLILCVSLPRCADRLCNFVRDSKVEVPGAGDVVGYSTFDFDTFEDDNWNGKGGLNSSTMNGKRQDGKLENGRPKTKDGKMEKSFFNFKSTYPSWTLPPSGKNLVDMVETYRQQQEIALARERRLHIDAALLTLRRLEMERERKASSLGLVGFVNNRHVKVASGADSGGGGMPKNLRNVSGLSDFGSMGSFSDERLHHPHVHFEDSMHSFIPPTHAFAHSSLFQGAAGDQPSQGAPSSPRPGGFGNSVLHYADAGLSMELRGLLDRSSLVDPSLEHSFTGSLIPVDEMANSILDMRPDHQYSLLDRYHSEPFHQQQQRQQQQHQLYDDAYNARGELT